MLLRQISFLLLLAPALLGQTPPSGAPNRQFPAPQSEARPATAQPDDELAQIRADLDRMESLNTNMSSEIEFLRDQNLQILPRTNAQMWTILIRDLRNQIDRQQRCYGAERPQQNPSPAVKPSPH